MATRFDNLLDEFGELPKRPERQPTFLEIAGFAHRENACSDILAFFMNPANPHGLGTLFLDALARTGGIQNQETMVGKVFVDREVTTEDREVTTKARKRIDLLIQSDSHAILIENKIFAPIDNPFRDYAAHLDSLPQVHKHKFLLTLKPHPKDIGYGFQEITYGQLVDEIRRLLGGYVAVGDTRYLTFMLDFLNTLDYLRGDMVVNSEFVGLLASRSDESQRFLKEIEHFKCELREKVKYLSSLIDVREFSNVKQFLWPVKLTKGLELQDILAHHIEFSSFEKPIGVDTVIRAKGWEIQFWVDGDDRAREELRKLLQRLDLRFDEDKGSKCFILNQRFKYGDDLGQIHPVVRDVVHKLATSNGAS